MIIKVCILKLFYNLGHKYDIPVFCLNEPLSFPEKDSSENGLNNQF